ncbi:MAG: SGNH/GDSL hydrolase family protein [Acidobacteria bacterium]|nr:SGNH/GDSL hydrolase family protein [Acidobacteriota bacterium]
MRNFAKKLLLILFSTFFGLAICEIGLRLLGYKYSGSTWTSDPLVGVSLRPGASAWEVDEGVAWTRINSHGYRDLERTVTKPQGVYRVAVLGDSCTEARQVDMDKTFTSLAEAELNRRHCSGERQVEVLNFGIGGVGTGQELLLLRERVWKFNPDMIVLQFLASNDLFNNYRALNISAPHKAPYFLLRNGKLELDESFRQGRAYDPTYIKLKGLGADIMNRSVLLQLVYKLSRVHAQRKELARLNDVGQTKAPSDPNAPPPEYPSFLSFLPPSIPSMVEAWQVTEALILELGKEAGSHHAPLLIMTMPANIQIQPDPNAQEAYRAKYKIESLEYADDRVERHARANGIPVLPLSKPLLEEARRTGTYMAGFANTAPNSGHLNERGHVVVARELVQAVCEIAAAQATAKSPSQTAKSRQF